MSVTDTALAGGVSALPQVPGVSPVGSAAAVEAIDRTLFTTPTFTIDADNERVAGYRTVALARVSVSEGHATSWVATVRPGVVVVDVDLDDDDLAAAILSAVIEWCDEHSVWSLARRSGGGEGRWHLFAVPAELEAALSEVVERQRQAHRLTRKQIDQRTAVRPLGAPHRRTGHVSVPEDVERAARALAAAVRQPAGGRREGRRAGGDVTARPALTEPLAPLPGAFWDDVARRVPRGSRSSTEFALTVQMYRAGLTEDEAWRVVANPAHEGLARSRGRGRTWWRRYSWNAVRTEDSTPLASRAGVSRTLWTGPYDWTAVVVPAALAVRRVWHRWPTRQRHSIDHVMAVIADRYTRRGLDPLPLSLRSLVEDSGLAIGTCRMALGALVDAGLLSRVEGEANHDGTRAHVYALNTDALVTGAVVDTPSSYTPPPGDPLWLGAPSGTLSHWLSLHVEADPSPSRSQAHAGHTWLVDRDLLSRSGTPVAAPRRVVRPRAGLQRWKALRERHAQERSQYRGFLAQLHERARCRWEQGRQRARAAQAYRDQQRQRQWWRALPEQEKAARTTHMRAWFAGLSPVDQERRRDLLDTRRTLATAGARVNTGHGTDTLCPDRTPHPSSPPCEGALSA